MKIASLFVLLSSLLLIACEQQNPEQQAIATLEKQLGSQPSEVLANELNGLYLDYLNQYPDDTDTHARYLYRAAALEYRMDRYSGAASLLKMLITDYRNHPLAAEGAHLLASIYEEKLQSPEIAQTIFQVFAQAFPNYKDLADIQAKIGTTPLDERLTALYQGVFDQATGSLNPVTGNHYIQSVENLAILLPSYPGAPELLLKAAETARTMRSFNKTLELYNQILLTFPDYEKAPQIKFLEAFTLDNDLKQYELAKTKYEAFLAAYPDHEFADDTRFLLENLGKTDEDIIKNFEK